MPEATLAPFTCPDCGRTLLLTPNGSRRRCPECSAIRQKQQIRESTQRRKARKSARSAAHKRAPKPESNMQKIARMAAEACALGLSYGQYAAQADGQE